MKEFEIGLQTTEDGPEYFGLDEVNEALANGGKVTKVEMGEILVFEAGPEGEEGAAEGEEEEEGYILAGVSFRLQVE